MSGALLSNEDHVKEDSLISAFHTLQTQQSNLPMCVHLYLPLVYIVITSKPMYKLRWLCHFVYTPF
jgi:hypothetical protein